jgi:hypothetical protein
MGAGSLSVNYAEGFFEGDLVLIPYARPSMLPGVNSRWLPRQVYYSYGAAGGPGVELLLPNQLNYSYLNRETLGQPLANNAAMRLQAHLDSVELAVYGYSGVAPVPVITPVVSDSVVQFAPLEIIQVNSGVQLQLQDYREQIAGASFTKTMGSWQLKAAGAWTQAGSEAASYENWSDAAVVGLEKSWDIGTRANLVTVLQYSSCQRAVVAGNDLSAFTDFFNSNWMLGGHLVWRDNDTITFFYAFDVLTSSNLGDVSYSRRFSDSWSMTLGGTTVDGPASSPIGAYASNKSMYFNLGWSY